MLIQVSSANLLFLAAGNVQIKSFTASSEAEARRLQRQIMAALAAGSDGLQIIDNNVPWIDKIQPSIFNPFTDTVLIYGSGFSAAPAGKFYIEDVFGGTDKNGLYMNCTVINDNQMSAVFGDVGDGSPFPGPKDSPAPSTSGSVLLFYNAGTDSNGVNGTVDANNIVTVIQ